MSATTNGAETVPEHSSVEILINCAVCMFVAARTQGHNLISDRLRQDEHKQGVIQMLTDTARLTTQLEAQLRWYATSFSVICVKYTLFRMKIYLEHSLALWLRLAEFTELNKY